MSTPPHPSASADGLRTTVLFHARQGGYHSYRIPGLAVTARGTILAYCEARKESPWDDGPIDILLRRSFDGGETWSAPAVLVAGGSRTANNAVMIATPGASAAGSPASPGAQTHFLYCLDYNRCFHTISRDDGATFDPPTEITAVFESYRREYDWTLIATGPGHGIRLGTGRLLVPVWLSTSKTQKPTAASVIYSDDHGVRWNRGPIIVRDGDGQGVANPMEPVVVELGDGSVLLNVRNASPVQHRAVSISPDGVNGWSPFRFDPQLNEPFCMGSLCRLPARCDNESDALLWANPDALTQSGQPGTAEVGGSDRKRLTVKLSTDEGKTWPAARVLEPGWSGYSDLAVGPDGTIYCLYESGCIGDLMWDVETIRLARFGRKWVMG